MTMALVFPTVFCVGAFSYVSWVFPGSGWSFLAAPSQSLAAWIAGMARLVDIAPTLLLAAGSAVLMPLALAGSAPLVVAACLRVIRRPALLSPQLIVVAATIVAALFAVVTRLVGDPAVLLVAAPVLAATAVICIPDIRQRTSILLLWLALGWLGGGLAVVAIDPRIGLHVSDVIAGTGGDRERIDALNLGSATVGLDGVLVDTFNAPAVILGRGGASGLLGPNGEPFALTMMFRRVDTPFVALPDPQSATGAHDRLNRAFPHLYRRGLPGYEPIYRNTTWRLFQRVPQAQP
jgi:hypothetical protein